MSVEQAIVVQKLKLTSLLSPILVGAALLTLPLWGIALIGSAIGGATINGEHVTGLPAITALLVIGPLFAIAMGLSVWLYASACLWAYSKWSELRLEYTPR